MWMYDSTFYSKKYKCPLISLFYLEIIGHTLISFFYKKIRMLHSSLAYMQLNETSPNVQDFLLESYGSKFFFSILTELIKLSLNKPVLIIT